MPIAVITVKGQTTIPKTIRNHLNLHPGDRLDFVIKGDGKVVLEPATLDVKELDGVLHKPGMKAVSVKEMQTAIKRRFKRI